MSRMGLIVAMLALPALLYADVNLSVGYSIVGGSGSCSSSLASTANSETLDVGPCTPAASRNPAAYVIASAEPFHVSLDGEPGYIPATDASIDISASAEWDGAFVALGGSGSAFVDFYVSWGGLSEFFTCGYAFPGVDYEGLCVNEGHQSASFSIPVTFGGPIDYSLFAQKTLDYNAPEGKVRA